MQQYDPTRLEFSDDARHDEIRIGEFGIKSSGSPPDHSQAQRSRYTKNAGVGQPQWRPEEFWNNASGFFNGYLCLRQFGFQSRLREYICRMAVRVGMVLQQMPLMDNPRYQRGIRVHPFSDTKKCRMHLCLP